MRRLNRLLAAFAALAILAPSALRADPPRRPDIPVTTGRICHLIEIHADRHDLPRDFFARLIWKESRFDPNAVSPAGAEGIAQFMPGTAAMRGLDDSFDVEKAIPASAAYLGELNRGFGNLGLAAAAYNAGENRVSRWLSRGGYLPMETEGYVLDVMGEPVNKFADVSYRGIVHPLDLKTDFRRACRDLPTIRSTTVAMASIHAKPWGVQVAGNFRRAAALKQWSMVKARHAPLLGDREPVVSRVRSTFARAGIYAVRIGADDRAEADRLCGALRRSGGACVVLRNR
ncbi:MAG: transglycosylase SLT domain-containing protein [Rhizobiaceae bacterium]